MNLFLTRILLSLWALTPFGRKCATISEIWMDATIAAFGAPFISSELDIRDALYLLRNHSFKG